MSKSRYKHPFGRQNEVSVQFLFKSFCNHLHLGQWELAASCISELDEQKEVLGQDVSQVLRALAWNPFNKSLQTEAVPSPHHLSWLALAELTKLTNNPQFQVEQKCLQRELDLRLLLFDTCKDADAEILQELYEYFQATTSKVPEPPITTQLSPKTQEYLSFVLLCQPARGHHLLHYLLYSTSAISQQTQTSNEAIHLIELRCLQSLLTELKCHSHGKSNESVRSSTSEQASNDEKPELSKSGPQPDDIRESRTRLDSDEKGQYKPLTDDLDQKFYELLSLYDPPPLLDDVLLRKFFSDLAAAIHSPDSIFKNERVLSGLFGRKTTYLVELFWNESTVFQDNVYQSVSGCYGDGESQQDRGALRDHLWVGMCASRDRLPVWKDMFLYSYHAEKHFLDVFVEVALRRIQQRDIGGLSKLFHPVEFHPLKPVVLLLGWDLCDDVQLADDVLKVLWDPQLEPVLQGLGAACSRLQYQVQLTQWCLEKVRSLSGVSQHHVCSNLKMFFRGLELHSALYLLHHSTFLVELCPDQVITFLKESPVLTQSASASKGQTKNQPTKKQVQFSIDEDEVSSDVSATFNLDQERDINIYRAFCALKACMDILIFSGNVSCPWSKIKNKMTKKCDKDSLNQEIKSDVAYGDNNEQNGIYKFISAKDDDTRTSSLTADYISVLRNLVLNPEDDVLVARCESYRELYDEKVITLLDSVKEHASLLYPLNYRLEVLEDCLSLLFCLYDDVVDMGGRMIDSGDEGSIGDRTERHEEDASNKHCDSDPVANATSTSKPVHNTSFQSDRSSGRDGHDALNQTQKPEISLGHLSTASNHSVSFSTRPIGFLANELVVRDVLLTLRGLTADLDSAYQAIYKSGRYSESGSRKLKKSTHPSASQHDLLTNVIKCGIPFEQFASRRSQLAQFISEALWRFQLVVPDWVPKELGKLPVNDLDKLDLHTSDLELDISLDDDIDSGSSGKLTTTSVSPALDGCQGVLSAGTDGSQSGGASTSSTSSRHRRRWRRRRSAQRAIRGQGSEVSGIIPRMLCDKNSLLCLCLIQGKFSQAMQVVKMFGMEKAVMSREAKFSEQFTAAITRLRSLDVSQGHHQAVLDSHSLRIQGRYAMGKTNLSTIANMAAAGISSISVSSIVDQVLGLADLPSFSALDDSGKSQQSSSSIDTMRKLFLDENNMAAMIVQDLACVSPASWETSQNLINMAEKRLPVHNKTALNAFSVNMSRKESTKSFKNYDVILKPTGQFGHSQLLKRLLDSLALGMNASELSAPFYRNSLLVKLTTCSLPIDESELRNFATLMVSLEKEVKHVSQTMKEAGVWPYQPRPAEIAVNQVAPVLSSMKSLLICLQRHTQPIPSWPAHVLNRNIENREQSYLQAVIDHVTTLTETVRRLDRECQALYVHVPLLVLRESPVRLLAKLVFDAGVNPSSLESVCQVLHVDLMHVLLRSCFPPVSVKPANNQSHDRSGHVSIKESETEFSSGGPMILNNFSTASLEITHAPCSISATRRVSKSVHPEKLVRGLLTRLVKLLKDASNVVGREGIINEEVVRFVINSNKHLPIIRKTKLLQKVDLSKLGTAEQKLCFYCNLITLMGIHMWLRSIERENCAFSSTASDHQRPCLLKQTQMAYIVGQLGIVSYFDLRYIIMRQGLPAPADSAGTVPHIVVDLDPEDPWSLFGCSGNPYVTFTLADGTAWSPLLQVLNPQMVHQQLEGATRFYLENTVHVDEENRLITVPPVLSVYKADLAVNVETKTSPCGVGDILHDCLTGDEAAFKAILGQDYSYEIKLAASNDKSVVYALNPDAWKRHVMKHQKIWRRHSWPPYTVISHDSCDVLHPVSDHYLLTDSALSYLDSHNDLVGTIAAVIATEKSDSILTYLRDDYFQRSTSRENDQDLLAKKSTLLLYRQKSLLDKFPVLARHLCLQTAPLLVSGTSRGNKPLEVDPSHMCLNIPSDLDLLDPETKSGVMSNPDSGLNKGNIIQMVCKLLNEKKWEELLDIFKCFTCELLRQESYCELRNLHDYTLCCAINESVQPGSSIDCSPTLLLKICDPDLRSRMVLGSLKHWDVEIGLQLLKACRQRVQDRAPRKAIQMLIEKRLNEMKVYQKISLCAKELLSKLGQSKPFSLSSGRFSQSDEDTENGIMDTDDLTNQLLQKLCQWQGLVEVSKTSPEVVLEVLTYNKDFETAYKWAFTCDVYDKFELILKEVHVMSLLERSTDTNSAFQVLEELRIKDTERCFQVCSSLLEKLSAKSHVLFVAQFLVTQLKEDLGEMRLKELTTLSIGCKGLLCVPSKDREDYEHLVTAPLLLLEQLIMNNRVEWSKQVLDVYTTELRQLTSGLVEFSIADCDTLLETYATKALEFPVLEAFTEPQGTEPLSRPISRLSSGPSSFQPLRPRRHSTMVNLAGTAPSLRGMIRTSSASVLHNSGPAVISGASPVSFRESPAQAINYHPGGQTPSQAAMSPHPGLQSQAPVPGSHQQGKISFVMPSEPPSQDKWVPDAAASVCMVCRVERFSMFNRRHHCRRCGRVVCGTCSQRTTIICDKSARTCDQCFRQIFPPKKSEEQSDLQRLRNRLSNVSPSSTLKGSPRSIKITVGSPPSPDQHSPITEIHYFETQQSCSEFVYRLSLDEELNKSTREEFYYDYAPSTSLCLSILDLHSSSAACARVLLNLCDSVSCQLRPIAPGLRNPEVDYGLVITMLKTMLINAKVKYLKAGDTSGISQCGLYIDRVNLLDLLLANNCTYIPTVGQLTQPETLRRLRNRLLEEERFTVAMEVSTKCGMDSLGVWVAWGMACLRVGDHATARDKFNKCLKHPLDKNQGLVQSTQKILADIIECLENSSNSGGVEKFLSKLGSVKSLLADPKQKPTDEHTLDDPVTMECLYYLHSYGNHSGMVNFYRKHNYITKAVHYILDQHCSSDVFVESLLLPSLSSGGVGHLLEQLQAVDHSLEQWLPHLMSACKHLSKKGQGHVLYQLQLFMKDYLRGAMTCIHQFYPAGATSYLDLHKALPFLHQAKKHMDTYLGERGWTSRTPHPPGVKRGEDITPSRLILTPVEVNKYIQTIEMQVEVTKFLHHYHDNYEAITIAADSMATRPAEKIPQFSPGGLPTLFGSTRVKAEVASLILLCGNNAHDGYGLAFRIMQHFKLDAGSVYIMVGQRFAKLQRYNSIRQLLTCIRESGMCTDNVFDDVISNCVKVISMESSEKGKEIESLIKLFRSDTNKINAYITCGKLKSAYLLAVKLGCLDDVHRIHQVALQMGQQAVSAICQQYLTKHKPRK